jgi:hypothetical protein
MIGHYERDGEIRIAGTELDSASDARSPAKSG